MYTDAAINAEQCYSFYSFHLVCVHTLPCNVTGERIVSEYRKLAQDLRQKLLFAGDQI